MRPRAIPALVMPGASRPPRRGDLRNDAAASFQPVLGQMLPEFRLLATVSRLGRVNRLVPPRCALRRLARPTRAFLRLSACGGRPKAVEALIVHRTRGVQWNSDAEEFCLALGPLPGTSEAFSKMSHQPGRAEPIPILGAIVSRVTSPTASRSP